MFVIPILLSNSSKVMQTYSVLMAWNTGAFSTDRLHCLLSAFLVFTVGLSTNFAARFYADTGLCICGAYGWPWHLSLAARSPT